jgi:hypothetical protein
MRTFHAGYVSWLPLWVNVVAKRSDRPIAVDARRMRRNVEDCSLNTNGCRLLYSFYFDDNGVGSWIGEIPCALIPVGDRFRLSPGTLSLQRYWWLAKQAPRVAFVVAEARHSGSASGVENRGETMSAKGFAGESTEASLAYNGRPQKHQAASIPIV